MLINDLNKTNSTVAQAARVSRARAGARKLIADMTCPNELLRYSERLYTISKQHFAANSLQREAELATQKSIEITNKPEHVAWTVIRDGADYFRKQGKCPNYRLYQMRERYGSWTLVHKRLIEKGFGGDSLQWLRSENKVELTSEWFIARHAPELVSPEMLDALNQLLAADVATYDKAA